MEDSSSKWRKILTKWKILELVKMEKEESIKDEMEDSLLVVKETRIRRKKLRESGGVERRGGRAVLASDAT